MPKKLLIPTFLMTSVLSQANTTTKVTPPNIVLFIADDMSWHDIACYGNPDIKTPNIDKLAQEGVRFTHSFTATAMCAPTRQQLYTGLFPIRNGAYPNHSQVYKGTKSIVHHLKSLGYRVGLGGKTHFGPRASFPFEMVSGRKLNFNKIENFIKRDPNQPFCLIVASNNPHAPWTEGDPTQYDAAKLILPSNFVDTPKTRTSLTKYYAEVTAADKELGKVMTILEKQQLTKDTLTIFTSEQGSSFPFAKWTCYDSGLRTATVMRWPGKIKENSISKAMIQYVDVVPTLIEIAGGNIAKFTTGQQKGFDGKSFKDVLLNGKSDHNEFVYGIQTSNGIIAGGQYGIRSVRSRQFKLIQNLNYQSNFSNLITASTGKLPKGRERYRCQFWPEWVTVNKAKSQKYAMRPEFELYNVEKDSYEQNNLIDHPEYQELVKRLKSKLSEWMKQQGDQGLETEAKALTRQKRH